METTENTYYLFEYGTERELHLSADKIVRLEAFLEEIWENRSKSGILAQWYKAEEEPILQPLLQIRHKRFGKAGINYYARALNYVGVIRFEDVTFHLMPKLFRQLTPVEALMQSNAHLLWWLSYNQWLNLPKQVTALSLQKASFLEILIHLFATYTHEQVKHSPYQTFQEIEGETAYVKGQLLFGNYVIQYLSRANYQKMHCRYDSFELDNKLNRIVKYVCRQLVNQTQIRDTRQTLNKIIDLLSEVSDITATATHCDEVALNRMFGEYQMVLDYCRMFLRGIQTTTIAKRSEAFAFLVPMEKVFEEFVYGFMKKEMKDVLKVTGQYQKKFLTTDNRFRLRPDLYIQPIHSRQDFIADTKYKLLYSGTRGIVQADLYQMLTYAIRHKTDAIKVLYPKWENEIVEKPHRIEIRDEFAPADKNIKMDIHKLEITRPSLSLTRQPEPIWKAFQNVKEGLKESLQNIFTD